MKHVIIFLIVCASSIASAQTIRIADNNANRPTGANIFSTVQAAVNAAVPGDIIYVQPSDTKYNETVTISKRITLIGVGFGIPELGSKSSRITTINIVPSTDGVNSVANLIIRGIGMDFLYFTNSGNVGSFNFNNITFEQCSFYRLESTGNHNAVNNLTIRNCGLAQLSLQSTNGNAGLTIYNSVFNTDNFTIPLRLNYSTNPLISNNHFYKNSGQPAVPIGIQNSTGVRIEHNLFSGDGGPNFEHLSNALVVNNIFYGLTPGCINLTNTFRDNTFSNNLVLSSGFTMPPASNPVGSFFNSGINNLVGISPQFVNAPVSGTANINYVYTLLATSPCLNAATGGDNIGPSGGLYPITITPTTYPTIKPVGIPLITLFDNSGVVPQNQPLNSNIKAKAN